MFKPFYRGSDKTEPNTVKLCWIRALPFINNRLKIFSRFHDFHCRSLLSALLRVFCSDPGVYPLINLPRVPGIYWNANCVPLPDSRLTDFLPYIFIVSSFINTKDTLPFSTLPFRVYDWKFLFAPPQSAERKFGCGIVWGCIRFVYERNFSPLATRTENNRLRNLIVNRLLISENKCSTFGYYRKI